MTFNEDGLKIIKQFEGCELKAYVDARGIPTIGYGHTSRVSLGMVITQAQADEFLKQDVQYTARIVQHLVPRHLNDNQFSACVSLAYNIGTGRFTTSKLLKALQSNNLRAAADLFLAFDECKKKVEVGLERRRAAERALFLKPIV